MFQNLRGQTNRDTIIISIHIKPDHGEQITGSSCPLKSALGNVWPGQDPAKMTMVVAMVMIMTMMAAMAMVVTMI